MADRWLLVESDKGTVEVRRNGRHHSEHSDLARAMKAVSDERGPRDRVIHQEPDGYRRPAGRRRGWRR